MKGDLKDKGGVITFSPSQEELTRDGGSIED